MRLAPALVVLLALVVGCSGSDEPAAQPVTPTPRVTVVPEEGKPAGPAACRGPEMRKGRASGNLFATCVTAALRKHRTVRLSGEQIIDENVIGAVDGKLRFAPSQAIDMTIFNGAAELVVIKDRAWMKDNKGWIRAGGGSTRAETAQTQAELWRVSTALDKLADFYGSTSWRPSGKVEDVNGIRIREYVGAPRTPGAVGVPTEIWLSRANLPVRMVSHAQTEDGASTNTVILSDFGTDFEFKKPAMRR